MTRYRLPALVLLVTGLVAVVAIAARGRPLGTGGSSGGGPSSAFFDYGFTSLVIVMVALTLIAIYGFAQRPAWQKPERRQWYLLSLLLFSLALGLVFWGFTSKGFLHRFHDLEARLHLIQREGKQKPTVTPGAKPNPHGRGAQLRWDEVAIVLALLSALGVAAFVAGRGRPTPKTWRFGSRAAVSAALDESLDDLRSEPDLRKAIIAAYARMEKALAIAGLARRPAEAPLEYLERALGELEASAGAIRRLTDLFEWAKFSPHEPEPAMRDDAIDALVAIRDELRAPAAEPVAA
jgi:hypothetical protein